MSDESIYKTVPEGWLAKREVTTKLFLVQIYLLGVEYSLFFLTLWMYIKTLVTTSNPKLLHSMTSSSYLISAILFSPLMGKIVDITREVKKSILFGNTAIIIGNIMYSIYHSQFYLVFGKFISGLATPTEAVVYSELARVYTAEELTNQYSRIGIAYGAGFLIGPAINIVFSNVDVTIYGFRITDGNSVALFMSIIFTVFQLAVIFFVHDLSKEYDLKEELENKTLVAEEEDKESIATKYSSLKLFIDVDILIMYSCAFFLTFMMVTFDVCVPILIIDVIKGPVWYLNVIMLFDGILGVIFMGCIWFGSISKRTLYYIVIFSLAFVVVIFILFDLITQYKSGAVLVTTMFLIAVVLHNFIFIAEDISLAVAFASIIPSEVQTLGEGIYFLWGRFGSLVALLTSVHVPEYGVYYTIGFAVAMSVLMVLFTCRRKQLGYF